MSYPGQFRRSTPNHSPPSAAIAKPSPSSLPPNWEARRDRKSGRLYYLNHSTKSTSWTDPRPLPYGWETKKDSKTGKVYFIDHSRQKTTWTDPRPPLREEAISKPRREKRLAMALDVSGKGKGGGKENDEKQEISDIQVYEAMLQMAMADKAISPQEEEMLAIMRLKFGMSVEDHQKVCDKLGITTWDLEQMKEPPNEHSVPSSGAMGREDCIICFDAPANQILLDCMHLCLCKECAEDLYTSTKLCPKCRAPITEYRKVYF